MIYQRKDTPYWWYKFIINGKKHQGSTKRTNKEDAKKFAEHLRTEELDHAQFGAGHISIGEAMQTVIDFKDGSTKDSYDLQRRRLLGEGEFSAIYHLDPANPMHSLDRQALLKLQHARRREGLSANTRNREMSFLRLTYRSCIKWGYKVVPDLTFELDKVRPKTRYLSDEEVKAVIGDLSGRGDVAERAHDLFIVLLNTGLRLNEALSLRWSQVKFEERIIDAWRFKEGKPSPIGMTDQVHDILMSRKGQAQPFEHMDHATKVLREAIDRICNTDKQINTTYGKATIHSLRDTFASRLVQKNMSLHKVGMNRPGFAGGCFV